MAISQYKPEFQVFFPHSSVYNCDDFRFVVIVVICSMDKPFRRVVLLHSRLYRCKKEKKNCFCCDKYMINHA